MKDCLSLCLSRCWSLLVVGVLSAGCATRSPAPVIDRNAQALPPSAPTIAVPSVGRDAYVVKKGDTLYSIALDHGLDYKDLAAWNGLENANRILVGQTLRVKPPGSAAGAEAAVSRPIATGVSVEQHALDVGAGALKREPKAGKETYSDLAWARAQQKAVEPTVVAKVEAKPEAKADVRADAKPEVKPDVAVENKTGDAAANGEEPAWTWPAGGKLVGTFSEGGNKGIDIAGKAGDPVLAASGGKVVYSGTGLRGYGKLVIIKHSNTYLTAYAHNQNVLVKEGQSVARAQKIAEMGNTDADQVKLHFEVRRNGKPIDPLKQLPQR